MAEPAPTLVCPRCRSVLRRGDDGWRCEVCEHTYPVVAGIADLRLGSDRYLTLEEDRAKAIELDRSGAARFADLVGEYWRRTPEVPSALADRYALAAEDGVARAGTILDGLGPLEGRRLLDVGCGTGGLVVAAARRGADATGVDVALRWLVVARRQLAEEGVAANLVAADGGRLPFEHGAFDHVTCVETLEHAADQRGLLHGVLNAAGPGGTTTLVVGNRFTILPEPTVGLVGIGFLPRRLAIAYVGRRRHTRYQFVRPLSASELGALLGPLDGYTIAAGPIPPGGAAASPARRLAERTYDVARRLPVTRNLLRTVGPFLELRGPGEGPARWGPEPTSGG